MKYKKILLSLISVTVVLNLCGFSKSFCNFYSDHIYGIINNIVGHCTKWAPFAIGEIIMYLGAAAVVLLAVFAILLIFLYKKKKYRNFVKHYSKSILMTFVIFLFVYTTNWFIPFRSDVLKVSSSTRTSYSFEEITGVYTMIVNNINSIAETIPRDEDGHVIYDYTDADIAEAMRNESDKYSRLSGHYNKPKQALCSPFLSWMNIGGYNYIYTMEPTYNKYTSLLHFPTLISHEYAHHKGYYRENEAEFLSCVSLAESNSPVLQYSGYLEMYSYISEIFYDGVTDSLGPDFVFSKETVPIYLAECEKYPDLSELVWNDIDYAENIVTEEYENDVAPAVEETFMETSAEIAGSGWEIQADILQENIYSGLNLMLLQYYVPENSDTDVFFRNP